MSRTRSVPRNRTRGRTSSAVSTVTLLSASSLRLALFYSFAGDYFKQNGLFVFDFAQHSAQALDILTRSRCATQDDSYLCFRHIHAFIQDARGDYHAIEAVLKAFEDMLALGGMRFMSDGGNEMAR